MLLNRAVMIFSQKFYSILSKNQYAVQSVPTARHELKLLTSICPVIHVKMGQKDAEDMLCSYASVLGATLNTKCTNVQLAQRLIGNYYKALLAGKLQLTEIYWRLITAIAGSFMENNNLLEGGDILTSLR